VVLAVVVALVIVTGGIPQAGSRLTRHVAARTAGLRPRHDREDPPGTFR
jgi:hypothetical protein